MGFSEAPMTVVLGDKIEPSRIACRGKRCLGGDFGETKRPRRESELPRPYHLELR